MLGMPTLQPKAKTEKGTTSVTNPISMFQLLGVYCTQDPWADPTSRSTSGFQNLQHGSIGVQTWGIYFWILAGFGVCKIDLKHTKRPPISRLPLRLLQYLAWPQVAPAPRAPWPRATLCASAPWLGRGFECRRQPGASLVNTAHIYKYTYVHIQYISKLLLLPSPLLLVLSLLMVISLYPVCHLASGCQHGTHVCHRLETSMLPRAHTTVVGRHWLNLVLGWCWSRRSRRCSIAHMRS